MKRISTLLLLCMACTKPVEQPTDYYQPKPQQIQAIKQEVDALASVEELQNYLAEIGEFDQKYRTEEKNVLQQYGYESEEYRTIWEKIAQTDAENYFKVEAVLEKFGYPKVDEVGKSAASVPLMVIHHSPVYEHRTKHFSTIYQGYLKGDVRENGFELFLDRMYRMKFNRRFDMKSPYRMEEKVDTLVVLLELQI